MLQNYRTSNNFNEIIKIFNRSVSEDDCFVWQFTDGNRTVFPIKNFTVNEKHMTFLAELELDFTKALNEGETVYAKVFYRDTVFKCRVINCIENNVTFSIPNEVKTIEMRENFRFKFKPSASKHVTLSFDVDLMMKAKKEGTFQVIDVSDTGISIVVSEKYLEHFIDNTEIMIKRLQDMDLSSPYSLQFVYHQKFRFKSKGRIQTAYRVGFKTLIPISKIHLEYFTL
jgi:aspartate carbamoyltransferase regulatory subunit